MASVTPVFPVDIPPERLAAFKLVEMFTPPGPNQIRAPGTEGGANYGPISYSPRTGYLNVNAIDSPINIGRPARGYFSAFDPRTGELDLAAILRRLGAGWFRRHGGQTSCFVGSGSNTAGYFSRVRREDRRSAVEVQYRLRRVLVPVGLHGQWRRVRDRRRLVAATRAKWSAPDPQLCSAEVDRRVGACR